MSLEETLLDVRAVLVAYFDGINSERYDDVAALFAEDGVLIAPGIRPRRGREEIAAYFPKVLARYPEHFDDATRILVDGRAAAVEIDFTGKLDTGEPIRFQAIDIFDLDAQGRIARLSTWYDSHSLRRQLGS
jgi:uncharacterized protein (TIGR02246 family)